MNNGQSKPKQSIIGSIFETYNYELFKTLEGNRKVNKGHIKRLIESFKEQYLISPIIVNSNMAIIDGQHRFEAAKQIEYPIRYIIDNEANLRSVQLLNAKNRNWSPNDYMNSYISLGHKDYITYKQFKDKYKFTHQICQTILMGCNKNNGSSTFNNGEFKITNLSKSIKIADYIYDCSEHYDGANRRGFVYTLLNLWDNKNFNKKIFLKKLSNQRAKIYDCAKSSQYLEIIEEIYNYRNRNKVNLRI